MLVRARPRPTAVAQSTPCTRMPRSCACSCSCSSPPLPSPLTHTRRPMRCATHIHALVALCLEARALHGAWPVHCVHMHMHMMTPFRSWPATTVTSAHCSCVQPPSGRSPTSPSASPIKVTVTLDGLVADSSHGCRYRLYPCTCAPWPRLAFPMLSLFGGSRGRVGRGDACDWAVVLLMRVLDH